jgi:PAS domain S-box-containing protein
MRVLTQQAAASSDVADALRRIEAVLKLSRTAVWEVDREGVFTYVSSSFEDLLGYRPEELVGRRTIHDFYPAQSTPELEKELSEDWIGQGEEFAQLAVPLVAKSGEIVWVSSSGMPIRDGEGRVVGFRGADRDITALKQAEENLRANEQTLWRQIQEAPVPMALSDSGDLQEVNRAFVRTFGYAPDEVASIEAWFAKAYPDEVYREQVRRDAEEWFAQAAKGEVPQTREYRVTCKDGRVLDVEVAGAVVAGRFVGTFTDVSSRRRELEMRAAREEELRRVMESLPFPVVISTAGLDFDWQDARAEVTFVNRRFTALFGYEHGDVPTVSDWARQAFPDEKKRHEIFAVLDRQVQAALRGDGEVGPVEIAVVAKNGEPRDVLIQAVAVGNQLVTSMEDVTERNRVRAELEEREAKFRRMIENAPVAISFTREGGSVLSFNKAFTRMFGWTSEDVSGFDGWFEKIYPDPEYRREVLQTWGADVENARQSDGRIGARVYRIADKTGAQREVEISAVLFGGEMFGTFVDLTERNRAERLLAASEASLRGLVENAPLGIVRLDLATGRLWANKAFTDALGYTTEDIPDLERWMQCAYPDPAYRGRIVADWAQQLQDAQSGNGKISASSEVKVIDKFGAEHEMQFSGILLGGEVFGLWVDLTERNRAERLFREQRDQLARVGRVSALGQLAASLAHELDQPLGAILNNAETAEILLTRTPPDLPELHNIVRDIIEDDRRAGAVLDRIRAMVQKQSFARAAVDVSSLFAQICELVRPVIESRKIRLETSVEPGLSPIDGDTVLLQQALLNLVLNAADAIGARADGLIQLRAGEALGGSVAISVGDNGGGVSDEEKGRLLEPFHTTKEGGLGMGLPIVANIVEQHGGQLHVENLAGRGLTVTMTLPA